MQCSDVQNLDVGQVHFGFDLAPEVEGLLQRAATTVGDSEAALAALESARDLAPHRLEVLQALYKFLCYRGELTRALDVVTESLDRAAEQGGFRADWNALSLRSADWDRPRGAARSYLYSLKALAFIRLRQNDLDTANSVLGALARLDPEDLVGAQVVRDLAERMTEDADV